MRRNNRWARRAVCKQSIPHPQVVRENDRTNDTKKKERTYDLLDMKYVVGHHKYNSID